MRARARRPSFRCWDRNGAREQAHFLVDQAVQYLASYGEEADLLRALAWFIVERDR